MKNAWIIFVIYLLVKMSVLGARHINKQDYHSYNQTTYGSTDQGTPGMPDWYIPLVNRIVKEGKDVSSKLSTKSRETVHTKKIERLEKGNKNK